MAGAQLPEGKFEQDAGFAEAGGSLEKRQGLALEQRGEFGLRSFLAGPGRGERRAKAEVAQPFARAQAQVEKLRDLLQPRAKKSVVRDGQRNGLGQTAVDLHENEFRAHRPTPWRRGEIFVVNE